MSATVLISGKLFRDPAAKTSRGGNSFAYATVRDGQGDDAVWWKVFAFGDEAREELLSLKDGDGVAVSGSLRAEIYSGGGEPRVSLSVTADRLISTKRQKREKAAETRTERKAERRVDGGGRPFDDGVPF